MENKKTLVIGASEDTTRYANLALRRLLSHGHDVVAIGSHAGKVQDVEINTEKQLFKDIDTVTLYLRPEKQKEYYKYLAELKPKRVIFNPGTENPELETLLSQKGIEPVEACTLVMLSTGQF